VAGMVDHGGEEGGRTSQKWLALGAIVRQPSRCGKTRDKWG